MLSRQDSHASGLGTRLMRTTPANSLALTRSLHPFFVSLLCFPSFAILPALIPLFPLNLVLFPADDILLQVTGAKQ
jgi:hypothetical protein